MRGVRCIVIDVVHDSAAAARVIRNIFDVSCTEHARRKIEARDLNANAMSLAEEICHRKNLNRIFLDLSQHNLLARVARERHRASERRRLYRGESGRIPAGADTRTAADVRKQFLSGAAIVFLHLPPTITHSSNAGSEPALTQE
jgi:hypothetical protein